MTDEYQADTPIDLDVVRHDYADDEASLYLQRAAERGRHEIVLGSIRAHLEEQPTPVAVLSAVRRWIGDVIAVGDEVAKTKRRNPG
ncbi:hypothetical protein ACIQPS_09065 [Streptomyces sp. NPDC091290]|uniref:hypothetical protein n=1 Tax=Streptomyces sp. NPDC091290 TaxID=3365990 RepID=UPI00380B2896